MHNLEKLRYPIGRFNKKENYTALELEQYIADIESFPAWLNKEVSHLNNQQLNTPYRQNGWTIAQVVNHCADSHINSLVRFKLTLTEEKPVIKPYFEDRWAELPDGKILDIKPSLFILEGLHQRWVFLLKNLTEAQLQKSFIHPEHGSEINLKTAIALYAWHCKHHLAHIVNLKKTNNWI